MNEFDSGSISEDRGNPRRARDARELAGRGRRTARWLSLSAVLFAFACGKSQNGTGNTNWQLECETSESCEGDSICQCNYCTPRCDGTLDCSLPPEEICVAPSSDDGATDDAAADAAADDATADDAAADDATAGDGATDAATADDAAADDASDDTASDDPSDDASDDEGTDTDAGETPRDAGGPPSPTLSCEDLAERADVSEVILTVRNARSGSVVLDSLGDCPEYFTIDSQNESSQGSWQVLWCGGACVSANGPQPVCGGCETPLPIVLAPGETTSFSWPGLVGEVVSFPAECCDTPPCPNTCTRQIEADLGAYQVNLRVADATEEEATTCGVDPVACPVSQVNGGSPAAISIPFEHTGAALTVEILGGGSAGECPGGPPADGSACAPEGLTCDYAGSPAALQAVCSEGQWVSISMAPEYECPEQRPVDGAGCEAPPTPAHSPLVCLFDCDGRSCALPDAPTPCTATQADCTRDASGEFSWTLSDIGTCPFTPNPECSERDPLTECELDSECVTLTGRPLGPDGTCYDLSAEPAPLGCAPADTGCAAVIQTGIDAEGTCWLFPGCMPPDIARSEPGQCPETDALCE